MEKLRNMESPYSGLFVVLAVLLVLFLITGCCTTSPIPGAGGRPVDPGTVDEHGNPAPANAICEGGKKCVNPGKGCGLFPYKNECTNVWNSVTNKCSCQCKSGD
jgi:hypothetical protein